MRVMSGERLYNLLPSIYRQRDAEQGGMLRALLGVLEGELDLLQAAVDRLYDNWFIETCAEWVVPYIGDLLGVRGLVPVDGGAFSQRGLVANTLAYRRGKGTAATLERLARDVTGWPARAVEFFDLLATFQQVNHVRLNRPATADLRNTAQLGLGGGPFETTTHIVDVRHVDNGRGKYNIPNIGVYLWRLNSFWLTNVDAHALPAANPALAGRYTFSPLGLSAPLFNRPRTLTDPTQRVGEEHVPGPLRRHPLYDELEARRQAIVDQAEAPSVYFGPPPVLEVVIDGTSVPAEQIACCDLSDPPTAIPEGWPRPPATKSYTPSAGGAAQSLPIQVAVDPVLGRLAFPAGVEPKHVAVSYAYGFSGDLGGGPYNRQDSLAKARMRPITWQRGVMANPPAGQTDIVKTLAEAIEAWNQQPPGTVGAITIMDSRSYAEGLTGAKAITIPAGSQLLLVAADWPEDPPAQPGGPPARGPGRLTPDGARPHLRGNLAVQGTAPADSIDPGSLVIDGLLIEGSLTVAAGHLGALRLAHLTLVPSASGLTINAGGQAGQENESLDVTIERCITGPITSADTIQGLQIVNSLVDGGSGAAIDGPPTTVQTSTVVGTVTVRSLSASNSIFTGLVRAIRRQTGCVRYCALPLASRVSRRFHCLPADEASAGRLVSPFTSIDYGAPGYGQLASNANIELTTGADDEGELGAFHFLQQPKRLKNLQTSLDEYLRFGLEAGHFVVT